MLELTPGLNGSDKGNCNTKRETYKSWCLVRLMLDVWQYVVNIWIYHSRPFTANMCANGHRHIAHNTWAHTGFMRRLFCDCIIGDGGSIELIYLSFTITGQWYDNVTYNNSLDPWKFEWNWGYVIFKQILVIDGWGISCEIALIWM